jgi:Mn-containing catalase
MRNLEVSYTLFNLSRGNASTEGRWACGTSMDGLGIFNCVEQPMPFAKRPVLRPAPPYIHDTLPSVLRNGDGLIPPSLK